MRIKLSDESEWVIRGKWLVESQLEMFRDRLVIVSPWSRVWVSCNDVELVKWCQKTKRVEVTMSTGAISWIPKS